MVNWCLLIALILCLPEFHSSPNCETSKWIVSGETRVGIFAKQDISVGMELTYEYNFEWYYGGANVRCLCGAANCSLFLGAKCRRFRVT